MTVHDRVLRRRGHVRAASDAELARVVSLAQASRAMCAPHATTSQSEACKAIWRRCDAPARVHVGALCHLHWFSRGRPRSLDPKGDQ
jgi:hypothetical protein